MRVLLILAIMLSATSCGGGGSSGTSSNPGQLPPAVTNAGKNWSVSLFPKVDWTNATYLNGTYFVTGESGTVLKSTDTIAWTSSWTGTSNEARALTLGSSGYAVAGFGETLAQSTDGTSWNPATPLNVLQADFYGIASSGPVYVATGIGGSYYSTDAKNWSLTSTGVSGLQYASGVAFASGRFVAVISGAGFVYSTDGLNWQPSTGTCSTPFAIAGGNNAFVALAGGGICTSSDGITWSNPSAPSLPQQSVEFSSLSFSGGNFYVVDTTDAWVSSDTINWTHVYSKSDVTYPLTGLSGTAGGYVLVGFNNQLLRSPDLVNWTPISSAPASSLSDVDYQDGVFVAVGANSTVLRSTDAVNWTPATNPPAAALASVTHGPGGFYATGFGAVYTSVDGDNWSNAAVLGGGAGTSITYANHQFLATGFGGLLFTSPDGVHWTAQASGVSTMATLMGVAYGAGRYVAIADDGSIITSTDAVTWKMGPAGGVGWGSIAYGSGGFVIVGSQGIGWHSADGLTWNPSLTSTTTGLSNVTYSNGKYVAVGNPGIVVTSVDGISWESSVPVTGVPLYSVRYGGGTFVAVGSNGTIIRSSN